MSPGPDSTTEEVSYDELHLLETGGLAPSSTAKTESVLTPRAISPVTDRLAVPPSQAARQWIANSVVFYQILRSLPLKYF